MKYIRTAPLFLLLVFTGILFTVLGIAGKDSIYAQQTYDPVKQPVLSVVFTAAKEEIYPWQMLETKAPADEYTEKADIAKEQEGITLEQDVPADKKGSGEQQEGDIPLTEQESTPTPVSLPSPTPLAAAEPQASPGATPFPSIEPIRSTTQEEYLNHISTDIYGDAGVERAASYEFVPVGVEWFDDALFIGDSRTVGLRDYTDLSEHGEFYCETSLTVYKVLEKEFKGKGTIPEVLDEKDFKKIYLMVGINELGTGTTESYLEKYTEVVNTLRELEPEAVIYIQGVMRVSEEKSSQDAIYNNRNINARNNAIATLADNEKIFYIDVNDTVCDEQGALKAEYTYDQIHLLGKYNELWKEFLLGKGVSLTETGLEE